MLSRFFGRIEAEPIELCADLNECTCLSVLVQYAWRKCVTFQRMPVGLHPLLTRPDAFVSPRII